MYELRTTRFAIELVLEWHCYYLDLDSIDVTYSSDESLMLNYCCADWIYSLRFLSSLKPFIRFLFSSYFFSNIVIPFVLNGEEFWLYVRY